MFDVRYMLAQKVVTNFHDPGDVVIHAHGCKLKDPIKLGRVSVIAGEPDLITAEALATSAGWKIRGDWTSRHDGYVIDVERPAEPEIDHAPSPSGGWKGPDPEDHAAFPWMSWWRNLPPSTEDLKAELLRHGVVFSDAPSADVPALLAVPPDGSAPVLILPLGGLNDEDHLAVLRGAYLLLELRTIRPGGAALLDPARWRA